MDIHDRRTTRKLEKKAVVLEKIRSEATKVLKFHISISCGYFGISTLARPPFPFSPRDGLIACADR